jgi:site-specific DNA recombinase
MKMGSSVEMNGRAVGYSRVSSKAQAKKDRDGLPRQKRNIDDFAQRNGMTVERVYEDVVQNSIAVNERDNWVKMLHDCKKDGIDNIIIEAVDRISRSPDVLLSAIDDAYKNGLNINNMQTNDRITDTAQTLFGRFGLRMYVSFEGSAEWLKVDRANAGRAEKIARGTVKPMGTVPLRDRQKAVHARIMRIAKDCRAQGRTWAQVADTLNQKNLPTASGNGKWDADRAMKYYNSNKNKNIA